ncbi:hypothetical protein [Methylosarcina fibrata]|uniref:hypothetical protein n=1 Tax=Methylosarcina fibrata TaxID=105972 RepID=UPI000363C536|nr:hypothetical protein [Methylosarcina fibrata]
MRVTEKLNDGINAWNVLRPGLAALALPVLLSACATEAEFLAENAPSAQNTALTRGRFELNCPEATATVLSQKVTYINGIAAGGYEWTEYTIGVRGCNKQTVYMVACRDRNNCNAFSQTANVLESGQ